MSFPISSKVNDSLCSNIAQCLPPLPSKIKPNLESVFFKVSQLNDIASLFPGNTKDLSSCASLLSRKTVLCQSEQSAYRDLLERICKIQKTNLKEDSVDSRRIAQNLNDALFCKRNALPDLATLLKNIRDLMEMTGMEFCHFSEWIKVFQNFYPYEERSSLDGQAWETFTRFYENRSCRLNQLLGDFAKAYQAAEQQRKQIERLRDIIGQGAQKRTSQLFELNDLKKDDWRYQSERYQRSLNSLLAEQSLESKISSLLLQICKFSERVLEIPSSGEPHDSTKSQALAAMEKKGIFKSKKFDRLSLREIFNALTDNNLEKVNSIAKSQGSEFERDINDLFTKLYDKIEKISSGLYQDKGQACWQQRSELASRSFRQLKQLKSSIPKITLSKKPIPEMDLNALIKCFEREVDLHLFDFQARILMMELVEWSKLLFNDCKCEFAQVTTPALVTLRYRFEQFWTQALSNSVNMDLKFSQSIEDLNHALEILLVSKADRNSIFQVVLAKLKEIQPNKRQERREALRYCKVFPFLQYPSECFPASLIAQGLTAQSAPIQIKRPPKGKLKKDSQIQEEIENANLTETSLFENWDIILKRPNLIPLGQWTSPFNYHQRVARWFNATTPLSNREFPEYSKRNLSYQKLMIQLHQLIPIADFFCHRGIELNSKYGNGEEIKRYILPAELRTDGESKRGVIIWAMNTQKICYHRFFHVKLESDQILNTVQRAFSDSQDSCKPDFKKEIKIQFENRKDDFIEIDKLARTALLRYRQSPDLALELRFIN